MRTLPVDLIQLGEGTVVDSSAILGTIGRSGPLPLILGAGSLVRSHAVLYAGITAGARFATGHGVLIREDNSFGDDVSIGSHSVLEPGNRIGSRCRIHSGCFLENVTLGDDVIVAPNVTFTDDPHPPCRSCTDLVRGATVGDGAVIGGNVTLLPGVRIGAGALIGAGSVVTRDIPSGMVAIGNPARIVKRVDEVMCRAALESERAN